MVDENISNLKLNKTDKKVLNILMNNSSITANEIAEMLLLTQRTIQRSMKKLVRYKLIIRRGSRKAGFWEVIEEVR